ncbi:DUF4365 domain-containing protein [Winogradskyella maritima]|uniref:DUF4365 domain-containing protein n=1 Tax=Winogradskyella maritima TaxID=1517766 RepID=A0ABV8AJ00_9FLAO|nr:DUF4365 domain-containing protein [Winogradskyella maritima]
MEHYQRLIKKNEATGIRVVLQYVREFWESGWQENEARNDKGIDGRILLHKKGIELGVGINCQVKCGFNYISSVNSDEIRISISNQEKFLKHLDYWHQQHDPTILVFVNPFKRQRDKSGNPLKGENGKFLTIENRLNPKAWWVNLKDASILPEDTSTIIAIPKKNTFGEHSKGDFLKLIRPLVKIQGLFNLALNKYSKALLNSDSLKKDAKSFYQSWKSGLDNGKMYCRAVDAHIRISKTGWNHITASRRGKERRVNSFRLLGVAKQIIEEAEKAILIDQNKWWFELEQKYGLRARIETAQGQSIVQVVLLRRKSVNKEKGTWWFYSVHYRT